MHACFMRFAECCGLRSLLLLSRGHTRNKTFFTSTVQRAPPLFRALDGGEPILAKYRASHYMFVAAEPHKENYFDPFRVHRAPPLAFGWQDRSLYGETRLRVRCRCPCGAYISVQTGNIYKPLSTSLCSPRFSPSSVCRRFSRFSLSFSLCFSDVVYYTRAPRSSMLRFLDAGVTHIFSSLFVRPR